MVFSLQNALFPGSSEYFGRVKEDQPLERLNDEKNADMKRIEPFRHLLCEALKSLQTLLLLDVNMKSLPNKRAASFEMCLFTHIRDVTNKEE